MATGVGELVQAGAEGFSLIDGGTVLVGLCFVGLKIALRAQRKQKPFTVRLCAVDFLNGIVVVPFLMMIGAAARPDLMQYLHDSRVSIAIAGVIGLFFVLGEIFTA